MGTTEIIPVTISISTTAQISTTRRRTTGTPTAGIASTAPAASIGRHMAADGSCKTVHGFARTTVDMSTWKQVLILRGLRVSDAAEDSAAATPSACAALHM